MKQGVPQGSVLSSILLFFYINQLAKVLPRETLDALFADDVPVLATGRKKRKGKPTNRSRCHSPMDGDFQKYMLPFQE